MKICLVSNLYPPLVQGGAEIYVARLARALAREHQVVVVTTEPGTHRDHSREFSDGGIVVYRLAPINLAHLTRLPHHVLLQAAFRAIDFYHPQVTRAMTAIIAQERPDVVHVHNWVGISLAAILSAAGHRVPLAMTLHDYGLICAFASIRHPDGHTCAPDLPCRLMGAVNRRLTRSVGLVISPSRYVLEAHLRRNFFGDAIRQVLPYGVETAPQPKSRVGKETFDALFMGRVQVHKGIEVLIRAFRRLGDPTVRLHVAGMGPSLDGSRALAAGDERIRFCGFVQGEARRSLLESADCSVLPSLWPDNYPISIQEAFQYGPVVIASNVGGIPEMVRDGINGLLVEPGNEIALAGAIERLRHSPDLVTSLRAAALETVRQYDMASHTAQLTGGYRDLLAAHRAGPITSQAA